MRLEEIESLRKKFIDHVKRLGSFLQTFDNVTDESYISYQQYIAYLKSTGDEPPIDITPYKAWAETPHQPSPIKSESPDDDSDSNTKAKGLLTAKFKMPQYTLSQANITSIDFDKYTASLQLPNSKKPNGLECDEIREIVDSFIFQSNCLFLFLEHNNVDIKNSEDEVNFSDFNEFLALNQIQTPIDETPYKHWAKLSPSPAVKYFETRGKLNLDYDPNHCRTARKFFFGKKEVELNYYRNQVFNEVVLNEECLEYFHNANEIHPYTQFSDDVITDIKEDDLYYACVDMQLSKHEWRAIPSLTSEDELTTLQCDYFVKIGYSNETNMYYARLTEEDNDNAEEDVYLHYNLKSHPTILDKFSLKELADESLQAMLNDWVVNQNTVIKQKILKQFSVDQRAFALANFFHEFTTKPGYHSHSSQLSGKQIFENVLKEKVGICSVRAQSYLYLAKELEIPCRMVINDLHAFVEIKSDADNWMQIDLGGGECQIHETVPRNEYEKENKKHFLVIDKSGDERVLNLKKRPIFSYCESSSADVKTVTNTNLVACLRAILENKSIPSIPKDADPTVTMFIHNRDDWFKQFPINEAAKQQQCRKLLQPVNFSKPQNPQSKVKTSQSDPQLSRTDRGGTTENRGTVYDIEPVNFQSIQTLIKKQSEQELPRRGASEPTGVASSFNSGTIYDASKLIMKKNASIDDKPANQVHDDDDQSARNVFD